MSSDCSGPAYNYGMTEYPAPLPHGPIEPVTDDVFWVRGSIGLGPGLRITRNMTIVRCGD